jgi:hypothetical protein
VDVVIAIAAVVDHHIDPPTLPLPALGAPQVKAPLAGTDLAAARISSMGEGPQTGAGRLLAQ